jgi:hypothetical protein
MAIDEVNWQNINPTQSEQQPKPVSMASAATIVPSTFLTLLTGTTAVATISPPLRGQHMLAIVTVATNHGGFATTGNILAASVTNGTTWDNKMSLFVYNPATQKYHPQYPVGGTNF